jgi:hypothetical protein
LSSLGPHSELVAQRMIPQMRHGDPRLVLWYLLFAVLGFLAAVFAVGAVWLLLAGKDTGAAICVAPVSAIIAGLVGLFTQAPGQQ